MIDAILKKHFSEKNFTREELYQFYTQLEPKLNKNTFAWRIYKLKQKGIIKEIARGVYSFYQKGNYTLPLSDLSAKTAFSLSKSFTNIIYCISDFNWINEFTSHQYINNMIIVEVEKYFIDSVFFYLKNSFKNVFLNSNKTELNRYISDSNNAIIIIPFITRAPITKTVDKKINIPTLEKMLVDIFTQSTPYFLLTDFEIKTIFENAFKNCNINITKLHAYSERRGIKKEITSFLDENKFVEIVND